MQWSDVYGHILRVARLREMVALSSKPKQILPAHKIMLRMDFAPEISKD